MLTRDEIRVRNIKQVHSKCACTRGRGGLLSSRARFEFESQAIYNARISKWNYEESTDPEDRGGSLSVGRFYRRSNSLKYGGDPRDLYNLEGKLLLSQIVEK